mgnify:CR=1 FL=1
MTVERTTPLGTPPSGIAAASARRGACPTLRTPMQTGIDIIHNAWSTGLDPSIPPAMKAVGNMTNSRAIIDACRPFHWKDDYPRVNMPEPELWEKAKQKFGYLLD